MTMFAIVTAIPAADPLPLPAPPWLLWILLMITFTLHVVAMNFVLGGSVIALFVRSKKDDDSVRLGGWMGKALPTIVAAAITFGVAPLLFLQVLYGRLLFSSAVLMGWFWLAVVPLLIVAYYGTYVIAFKQGSPGRWLLPVTAVVAVIFAGIAFIYSNNMTLMLRPERFLPMYLESGRGLQLNLGDAMLFPRYLHMLLGSIAVAGMGVALYGAGRSLSDRNHGRWAMRQGALWFTIATALNVVTGTWWGLSLPREVILEFMGGRAMATGWLAIGVGAGIAALVVMALASRLEEPRRLVMHGGWLTGVTLVAMIVSRDHVRQGMLRIAQFEPATWIEPQWGVIAIFAVLFVAAVATTVWMASLLMPAR